MLIYILQLLLPKIVFKIHYKEPPSEHASFAGNGDAPAGGGGGGQDVDDDGSDEEMVREICYYVRLRPGLQKFLQKAAALYEVREAVRGGGWGW